MPRSAIDQHFFRAWVWVPGNKQLAFPNALTLARFLSAHNAPAQSRRAKLAARRIQHENPEVMPKRAAWSFRFVLLWKSLSSILWIVLLKFVVAGNFLPVFHFKNKILLFNLFPAGWAKQLTLSTE
jgi:hypothetical protein